MRSRTRLVVAVLLALGVLSSAPAAADSTPRYPSCPRFHAYELRDCGRTHRIPWAPAGRQLRWALEPSSDHVVARRSDHDIQHEQPRLVRREIHKVVEAVRSGRAALPESQPPVVTAAVPLRRSLT
jgi:hypothetical protein